MQAFDRCHGVRLQQNPVRHALHPEDSCLLPDQFRQHLFFKAPIVRVHDVERHLYGIERETAIRRHVQHMQMDPWVLVPRETDIAELSRFPARTSAALASSSSKIRCGSSYRLTSWC